ncbi:MAG: ATP-dependent Clp protease proteolytic subunit [Cutibacterium granulosum]|nr:ATP-dependent Clp protease proteolytic subunit [Cutibacterium granulosum]MEA5658989.1 ATP-dependent Clp protease proteolytic subunit [Cutibacterium granulosum]MEA5661444.1 ATP-dependent Clp protease proteolytic subunit [Cutibacterium granulosum]
MSTPRFWNWAELKRALDMLEAVKESIINAYQAKTGLSRAKLSKLMDAETWMDARAAIDLGFVDGLLTTQDPHQLEPAKPPTDPVMFSRRCSEQTLINHCTTPPVTAPAPAGRRVVDLYAALTCKPH